MSLDELWLTYREAGSAGLAPTQPATSDERLYLSVLAFADGDVARAADWLTQEAGAPVDLLTEHTYAALRQAADPQAALRTRPEGFERFIRGGGNVPLYAAVSDGLRAAYEQQCRLLGPDRQQLKVLDVGCGDGRALLPALTPAIHTLDLVEPDGVLLAACRQALAGQMQGGLRVASFEGPIQAYLTQTSTAWDVIQATFSLQALAPDERAEVLRQLRTRGRRLLIAEFDVPAFDHPLAPDRTAHIISVYRRGLSEYTGDDLALVVDGFLVPMFLSCFAPGAARLNYEQPIRVWADQLQAAGFDVIRLHPLYRYWWAPAYLLDAR
jgi:SAM-dependent methyltransferase